MGNDHCREAMIPSPGQAVGLTAIADHHADRSVKRILRNGIDNRLQVRATAGDEYAKRNWGSHINVPMFVLRQACPKRNRSPY